MGVRRQSAAGEGGHEARDLADQAVEFQVLKLLLQSFTIHRAQLQNRLLGQGDVDEDFSEMAGEVGVVAIGAELSLQCALQGTTTGLGPLGFHFLQHAVHAVEVFVFLEQIDGRLGANPPHARDVVGAVAGEGLEVHHLVGHHAQLGHHAGFIDQGRSAALGIRSAPHVEHGNVPLVIHQLEQIPIPAENAHAPARGGSTVGQGSQHVIGFVSRCQAERKFQAFAQDRLQLIQVLEEHLRSHIAMGFVVGIGLMAEGGFSGVEGDGHPFRFQAFAVVEQGFEKAVGHAGRPAVFRGQSTLTAFAEGIETAKGQGVAVHKQQQGFLEGFRHGFGQVGSRSVALLRPRRKVDEYL